MAVSKVPQSSRVGIKVQTGVSTAGAPVYRVRNLQNVKSAAPDEDVYAVAQAMAALQQHSVVSISRVDEANLVNE
ncbi:DUF1659 domain-containing protein [Acetonema longum]|uniref:DUF1659 domain-containing protein n=1 Tax=Acetonema longum DSM 6540 TaxID=1009370 RepID=F7NNP1_9FIRM|nr:DUF1659 domain-containing protein [Acetonema longum]EGO62343.1 hypothetical protein ALO_18662 [Acetonema longum DSM 6540]